MKNTKTIFLIFLVVLHNFISCSKEDDPINQPPGAFTVTPVVSADFVKLSWTEAVDPEEGAVTYTVILEEETIASNLNNRAYKFENLEHSKNYIGKIIAYDSEGLTSQSSFSFETEARPNTAPTAPVLKSPAIGEESVPLTPKLVWERSVDAENDAIVYDVFLDKSTTPNTKIAENVSIISHSIKTPLDSESVYYWRVVARDAFNAETISARGKFSTGSLVQAVMATDNPGFADRAAHTSAVFKDKMWVIGGETCCGGRYSDVWSSADGETWKEEKGSKSFTKRSRHASTVFNGKIWITGGNFSYGAGGEYSDVWNSEDGVTWFNVKSNAAFGKRFGHKMVVFDNKMWILGGKDADPGSYSQNQVWNSTDGVNWTKITDDAGISLPLSSFIVRDNKIWRIGGQSDAAVYSTTDGKTWNLEVKKPPFGQRIAHSVVQYDNKIWVISGADFAISQLNEIPDVWYSEDGKDWKLATKDAGYKPVAFHTSVVYKDTIWIIGGGGGYRDSFRTNDVWRLDF